MKLFFDNMADPNGGVLIDVDNIKEFFNIRGDYVVMYKDGKTERFPRCVYNFTLYNRPIPGEWNY